MAEPERPIDDHHWQVPAFELLELSPKRYHTALIIPVLNEGERIQKQLRVLADMGHPVDIIIADGGSTDGSLTPDFLRQTGVRAQLIKTGPGKLSAQLRMAYAWALRQGYTGLITVDGNGKDGMDAIALFLDKLAQGYDYVQGSRYHKDGMHAHTPLDRTLANRMIHAPMLSLAGRTRLTDTTNGYRAYSARYLLDPQVQPFRDIFTAYELLFYLTVRAGQRGFRITEVPVSRTYPPRGKTPTKIAGLSGKMRLLSQTIQAASGRFTPTQKSKTADTASGPVSTLLIAVFFACLMWLLEGYRFGHGNHGQEVPPILAMLDPSLYTVDFAVQDFLRPGPRYFYYQLVAGLCAILAISVDTALLILKIFSHFCFFSGVVAIARIILNRMYQEPHTWCRRDIVLTGLFALFMTLPLESWGSDIYNHKMVPSTLGIAIAIWSIYCAMIKRWTIAFAIAGLAIVFHFLVGLFAGLVLLPALFAASRTARSWKISIFAIMAWIIPALAVYGLTLAYARPAPESFNFLETFGLFRVPHHWRPSIAGLRPWISDLALLVGAFSTAALIAKKRPDLKSLCLLLTGILGVVITGVLVNFVFVEIIPVSVIGKLQFQRLMPYGHLAAYILLLCWLWIIIQSIKYREHDVSPWLAIGICILFIPSVLLQTINQSLQTPIFGFSLFLIVITGVIFAYATPRSRIMLTGVALSILLLTNHPISAKLPYGIAGKLVERFQPRDPEQWQDVEIYAWLRQNTAKDALILIPPDWSSVSDLLALQSQRSVFFSFKNVPYSEHGVWEWSKRAEMLLGMAITPALRHGDIRHIWAQRSSTEIEQIARSQGACFLVDRMNDRQDIGLATLARSRLQEQEEWGLWQWPGCVP